MWLIVQSRPLKISSIVCHWLQWNHICGTNTGLWAHTAVAHRTGFTNKSDQSIESELIQLTASEWGGTCNWIRREIILRSVSSSTCSSVSPLLIYTHTLIYIYIYNTYLRVMCRGASLFAKHSPLFYCKGIFLQHIYVMWWCGNAKPDQGLSPLGLAVICLFAAEWQCYIVVD